MAYACYDDVENANNFLDRAIAFNPNNAEVWHQKAILSKKTCNFIDALESINKALALDPKNGSYLKDRKQFEQFAKISINFRGISDQSIRKTLETAERLMYQFFDMPSSESQLDLSPVIVMYGKGLEKFVNMQIVANLRENIFRKFPNPRNTPFWYGRKDEISPLPKPIKKLLDQNRKSHTMMLGEWAGLKNDFLKTTKFLMKLNNTFICIMNSIQFSMPVIIFLHNATRQLMIRF
jgi:tetratricopeptide (TPR) repeat protein